MTTPFQVFGSSDSVDLDVVFFVDKLGSIHENFLVANELSALLNESVTASKRSNANLVIVRDGEVKGVYKGTIDEMNNALFQTYHLHQQYFDLQITQLLPRNLELKLIRTLRKTLSYYSRTKLRPHIKQALRTGFSEQLKVLKTMDLSILKTEDTDISDIWKSIVFSQGQSIALAKGVELYTKNELKAYFPEVRPILERAKGSHGSIVQKITEQFIVVCDQAVQKGMKRQFE